MDAVIGRELKKFGLRPARTPQEGYRLSGVVMVQDKEGKGFSYVHFEPPFAEAVGKALPEGLHPEGQAYIKVIEWAGLWKVYAYYVGKSTGVFLWETPERPLWVAKVRRG